MKGCIHDYTLTQDECDCFVPHTNTADTGMPHESLVKYIAQLERERDALQIQLTTTLRERSILAQQLQIIKSVQT